MERQRPGGEPGEQVRGGGEVRFGAGPGPGGCRDPRAPAPSAPRRAGRRCGQTRLGPPLLRRASPVRTHLPFWISERPADQPVSNRRWPWLPIPTERTADQDAERVVRGLDPGGVAGAKYIPTPRGVGSQHQVGVHDVGPVLQPADSRAPWSCNDLVLPTVPDAGGGEQPGEVVVQVAIEAASAVELATHGVMAKGGLRESRENCCDRPCARLADRGDQRDRRPSMLRWPRRRPASGCSGAGGRPNARAAGNVMLP